MNKADGEECVYVAIVYGIQSLLTVADFCCFCCGFQFLMATMSCIKSSGKNKLKKSPAVAVAGRTVVDLVGLLKSSTTTISRLWHHRFSSWLSTKLLLLPLSSVLLLSLLSSAEISLSPCISALHDISSTVKPKKMFFTISVAFKNIANSHHMPESVCSSDLNFQKFTLY